MKRIKGIIYFEDSVAQPIQATIHVKLNDVSRAGASSITVAQNDLEHVSLYPGQPPIAFTLNADLIPSNKYTLYVHVDINGNGQISSGDYLTQEYFEVTVPVSSQPYRIRVRLV